MRVLWISPRWPEDAVDGAQIASYELLKFLQDEDDIRLTFLGVLTDQEPVGAESIRYEKVHILRRGGSVFSPGIRLLRNPLLPVSFSTFVESDLKRAVHELVRQAPWDCVVFDGMHAAIPFVDDRNWFPTFNFPGSRASPGTKLVYRAHNVEFSIWDRASSVERFPRKQAIAFQAKLVRHFEKSLLRRCDMTLPVSEDDESLFVSTVGLLKTEVIRIGQTFPGDPPSLRVEEPFGQLDESNSELTLGFIGRLDWLPNQQGLEWFLSEAWPELSKSHPLLRLKIAGSGNGNWLERHRGNPGIEFLGKIPSVETFYSQIDLALVPLFVGSGTRVKVIEASRYAIPCLSTRLGVEGCPLTPGVSYFKAESVREWIDQVASLATLTGRPLMRKTGIAAFNAMKKNYDSRTVAKEMADCLRKLSE